MPVNLNVSSTEPSIHTARDCVGNREKRARLVAFLDGADRRGGGWTLRGVDNGGGDRSDTRSGRYRPAGQGAGRGRLFPRERGRPPADRGDPLEVLVCGCAFRIPTRFVLLAPGAARVRPRDRVRAQQP